MHFIDETTVRVEAGDGGDGAIAFRREKFVPFGGPAGGDGGRGGDVVLVGDGGLGTLHDLQHVPVLRAERGADGGGRDRYGRAGRDKEVRVPLGTSLHDAATGEKLGEVTLHGQRLVIAAGGRGGRGNKHFATPSDRAPRKAEPGEPGERRDLRLELRLMADVGLVGLPNAGKSTFIRSVSRARPKVADYPFTTLEPHLGVVTLSDARQGRGRSFVLADIPGIIEGASRGVGLGTRFLRHVERTRVLLHLVTVTPDPDRTPLGDYATLRREIEQFDPELGRRAQVVAVTKADLPEVRDAFEELRTALSARGVPVHLVSAVTRQGIADLLDELAGVLGI